MGSQTRKDSINVFILLLLLTLGILKFRQTPTMIKLVGPLRVDESLFIAANNTQAKTNGKGEQVVHDSNNETVSNSKFSPPATSMPATLYDGQKGATGEMARTADELHKKRFYHHEVRSFSIAANVTQAKTNRKDAQVDYEVARFSRQNQSIGLVVLVMSARNDVERRNTIRKTWALEHTNVFFIVGNRACGIPFNHREPWTCSVKSTPTKSAQRQHNASMDTEDALLAMETQKHADLILVPIVDFYRALPHKLREAYHWALENTNAKWFVKIDDDSYVRVGELEAVARAEWVDIGYTMMAAGFSKGGVMRKGKWAETKYVPNTYPPFPSGAGHAVNRALASFVDNATLVAYQGEDTSIGIWMDEAPFVPTLLKHSTFESHGGDCFNSKKTVIGHNIPTKKILKCFEKTEMHEGVISEKAT